MSLLNTISHMLQLGSFAVLAMTTGYMMRCILAISGGGHKARYQMVVQLSQSF
jgi:hypothetical protein